MTSFGRRYIYGFIKRTKRAANEKRTLHQFFEIIRASSGPGADAKLTLPGGTDGGARSTLYVVKPFVGGAIRMLIVSLKQPQLYFSGEQLTHTHAA